MSWQDSYIIVLSIGFVCLTIITFIVRERERETPLMLFFSGSTLYTKLNGGRGTSLMGLIRLKQFYLEIF